MIFITTLQAKSTTNVRTYINSHWQYIQVLRPRQTPWQTCWTSAECEADGWRQCRASSHTAHNTVVLEVHRRCNCKYLLICKEDEIDRTFWKFTQQLLRATQMGDAVDLSSCAWRFLTHFRCNSSQIIRTTDERWMPVSLAICHAVRCVWGASSWLRTR